MRGRSARRAATSRRPGEATQALDGGGGVERDEEFGDVVHLGHGLMEQGGGGERRHGRRRGCQRRAGGRQWLS